MATLRKLVACCVALALTSCPGLGEILRQYGFTELKPPSKLFAPGTIVWVEQRSPFRAGIICTADRAMGHDFVAAESPTRNASLQRAAKKGVHLKAEVQQLATGELTLDEVESITLTFKNARLSSLTDADIADLAYKRRDARCIRAVELRKAAGFTVTMVSEALQADVDYTVNWSRGAKLTAEAKVAQLQQLSANLGLDSNNTTDRSMSGTGLYFGVRDDAFLAYLWLPEQLPAAPRNSMIFDSQSVTDVASECEDATDEGYCTR